MLAAVVGIATAAAFSRLIPNLNNIAVALISAAVFFSIRQRFSLSKYPMFWMTTLVIVFLNGLLVYQTRNVPSIPKGLFLPLALVDVVINNLLYLGAQFVTGTEDV